MSQFAPASFDAALADLRFRAQAGAYQWASERAAALLQTCPPGERHRRAQTLALLASTYPRLGNLTAAMRCGTEAVSLADELGDSALLADALISQAFVFGQLQLGRDALEAGLRALPITRRLADPLRQAWALNRVGVAYAAMEDTARAAASTEQALALATEGNGAEVRFSCLNNLAYFWLQALDNATQSADDDGIETALRGATDAATQAVELARRSSSPFQIAVALSNLVNTLLAGQRIEAALPLLNEFGHLAHEHGYQALALEADAQRAIYLRRKGEHAQAARMLQALLQAHREPPPRLRRMLLQALYETEKAGGNSREALNWLEQLVRLDREMRRSTLAVQTEVLRLHEQIGLAQAHAETARADADRERARATRLELEQRRLREQAQALDRAAHEDVLTGLHNRRHADYALPLLIEGARVSASVISVASLDVDHFKSINDRFGHAIGDAVLAQLAQLLRQRMREADLLARMGGEEFLAVLVGCGPQPAIEICERLRNEVDRHTWHDLAAGLAVTISVGVAGGPSPEQAQDLIERADRALYAAKRGGRNRVMLEEQPA